MMNNDEDFFQKRLFLFDINTLIRFDRRFRGA